MLYCSHWLLDVYRTLWLAKTTTVEIIKDTYQELYWFLRQVLLLLFACYNLQSRNISFRCPEASFEVKCYHCVFLCCHISIWILDFTFESTVTDRRVQTADCRRISTIALRRMVLNNFHGWFSWLHFSKNVIFSQNFSILKVNDKNCKIMKTADLFFKKFLMHFTWADFLVPWMHFPFSLNLN